MGNGGVPVVMLMRGRDALAARMGYRGRSGWPYSAASVSVGTVVLTFSDGSFSRNNGIGGDGAATYRTSANAIADAAVDVLRTDTIGGVGRYLFEGARSNYLKRTDIFGSTGWVTSGGTFTAATGDTTDPAGLNEALKCVHSASGTSQVSQQIAGGVIADGDTVTFSHWTKCAASTEKARHAWTDRSATTTNYSDLTVTTSWQRFSQTVSAGTGATQPTARYRNASDAVVRTVYAAFPQVEKAAFPSSFIRNLTSGTQSRAADSLSFASSEVSSHFRTAKWSVNVRPGWSNADLVNGVYAVICSTDANNWIGFEKSGGSLYLRCYIGGSLAFGTGAITVVADTDYPITCDLATGTMTFNGTAGSAGGATSLPGGVSLRWGGMASGTSELFGGTDQPVAA